MRVPNSSIRIFAGAAFLALSTARAGDDVPMRAMSDELARSMAQLQLRDMERPYFIAYRMDDWDGATISGVLGSLTTAQTARSRLLSVELRVGSYDLDNSNYFSPRNFGSTRFAGSAQGPLDDSYQEIRRQLWLATDAQYKNALESLSAKRAALRAHKPSEEVPDFAPERPHVETGPLERTGAGMVEMEGLVRELSAVFRSTPEIHRSSVRVEVRDVYTRYVNSEGSSFTRSSPSLRLVVEAEARSDDGLPVTDSLELHASFAADLPPRQRLVALVREIAARILRVRSAPSLERYNGPVLFEGMAAAEVFAQQIATALVATRRPVSDDPSFDMVFGQMAGQFGAAFQDKIGGRVLPEFLNVVDAPLLREYRGMPLLGGQRVDDDGVVPRETRLVEHGILKTLLTTRVPVRAQRASSGSRRGGGPAPSNLIVSADRSVPDAQLRRDLLRRARARGLEYGIVIRRMGHGGAGALFARMAARMGAPMMPGSSALAEVARVYEDGREEPLRGVELAELTPAAFRDVVEVGSAPALFNGEFMGVLSAMFGFGPISATPAPIVSYVVPALLFDEVSLVRSQGPFPSAMISASPLAAH